MPILISPRTQDIGFPVRRLLPARACQRVGPFIFVDHMGPALFTAGTSAGDVRQHPHIGLATVTCLFSGAMMHRDSTGCIQRIEPGAVNLMTAGRGIVHSERIPEDIRAAGIQVQGMQTWLALPSEQEACEPAFAHYPAEQIPAAVMDGVMVRVLIGSANALHSPVLTRSPATLVDLQMPAGSSYELNVPGHELAVYMAAGNATVNGEVLAGHHLLVLGDTVVIEAATEDCRAVVLGGAPLAGKRHIHWNFVSSDMETLKRAGEDWKAQRFALVPGETDWIPLPG